MLARETLISGTVDESFQIQSNSVENALLSGVVVVREKALHFSPSAEPSQSNAEKGMPKCGACLNKGVIKIPSTGLPSCLACFYAAFEDRIHQTITSERLFSPGDRVAIGASGGKDSTVLAYTLALLNERHKYGVELLLLSIDEGIAGYRDDSLRTVASNSRTYNMPLTVLSYRDLYGWTMDAIVAQIGLRNNCTFCGVFRRQALERGARMLGCSVLATGHNADDLAETVMMNVLRGDHARLVRCTAARTHDADNAAVCGAPDGDSEACAAARSSNRTPIDSSTVRIKPFKYTYEKEIVMYAYFKRLEYFSTECKYAPEAYRGHVRELLKRMESKNPRVILNIIRSGDDIGRLYALSSAKGSSVSTRSELKACTRCGFATSNELCKACVLLEGLNTSQPMLGITGRRRKPAGP